MVCRVCLKEAKHILQIFDEDGLKKHIPEILQKHLWFRPLPNDPISSVICELCWCKISDFHQFYEAVEKAHNELYTLNSFGKSSPDNFHPVELAEIVYNVKREETLDVYDAEKNGNPHSADNPLYEPEVLEHVVVKAENENDSLDNLNEPSSKNIEDIAITSWTETSSDEDTSSNPSEYEPAIRSTPSSTRRQRVETRKRTREKNISTQKKTGKKKIKRAVMVEEPLATETSLKKKRENRCWTKPIHDKMVRKHLPLNCVLCGFLVDTFKDMISHFGTSHRDTRPYILCCGRRISKPQRVVQHAYLHEDPNYFQCGTCKRSFSDNYVLRSHIRAQHPAEEEPIYQCEQCEKRFPRLHLLELHKPMHIPVEERKFMCTKCPTPKAFASDHLRQVHDNRRHKRATNVCHVCAKEIRDNQAFEKHVRLHFEDSGPRVKCPRPGCDRWLKDKDNLKQHLRCHNDEGKIITCEQCGKSVKNRRALSNHLNYAHSNALFSCEECKKTFKKAVTLKEHMAQHTGETLYKCPFCPRSFNSNANMHSHMKKMHPVERETWRKTKSGGSKPVKRSTQISETTENNILQLVPQDIVNLKPQVQEQNLPLKLPDGDAV